MRNKIAKSIIQAEEQQNIRVIMITGNGSSFCAGADISRFSGDTPLEPGLSYIKELSKASKPIIAVVQGYAVGGGATLLFHCDLVYAAESAKLRFPFTNLGLTPENASSYLLPKFIGFQKASEILQLAEFISAKKALDLGIVNKIFPDSILLEESKKIAQVISLKPPEALKLTKKLMKQSYRSELLKYIDEEREIFSNRSQSDESKEAILAFREKRKPNFSKST
jgi:enoyl-CoA hydratase/carnithine racemase